MGSDLEYFVHFFNNKEYLFKTITMAGGPQVDEICDTISAQKGWFWGRFAPGERHDYLQRRRFVEKALYEDYTRDYGSLKEKNPLFFYLYPNMTPQKAIELGKQRARCGEAEPFIMMVKIADIEDTSNITFTLNDSHAAYWQRIQEAGLSFGGEGYAPVVLPDHNKVFPFSMIEQIHPKYQAQPIYYEIQIWDTRLVENLRYTILGKEET